MITRQEYSNCPGMLHPMLLFFYCLTLQAKNLIQIIIGAGQVIGRAFTRALQREISESQNAARARSAHSASDRANHHKQAANDAITGMTLKVEYFSGN